MSALKGGVFFFGAGVYFSYSESDDYRAFLAIIFTDFFYLLLSFAFDFFLGFSKLTDDSS